VALRAEGTDDEIDRESLRCSILSSERYLIVDPLGHCSTATLTPDE